MRRGVKRERSGAVEGVEGGGREKRGREGGREQA